MTPEKKESLIFWLKLMNVKGIGPAKLVKLISTLGGVDRIRNAPDEALLATRVFNEETLSEFRKILNASSEKFEEAINLCEKKDIAIVPLFDERYPIKLLNIPSPPKTLFMKGNLSLTNSETVAMVGTRESSNKANEWASKVAKELAEKGYTIVSGGAIGIDTASHRGALSAERGKTICILGSGIMNPYPSENRELFEAILKTGGLIISEHLPTFPGSRIALIQRNRITSGLSKAVILCASKAMGGAMVQIKIAFEQRVPIIIPREELDLQPNEGLKQAKNEFKAIEISSAIEADRLIQSLPSSRDCPLRKVTLIGSLLNDLTVK